MAVEVATRGLDNLLEYFERLPEIARQAAALAVNSGAEFAQRRGARSIRDQVNFKASYLGSPSDGAAARLGITKRARGDNPEAIVRGRERPTSLARFVQGSKTVGRRTPGRPVRVRVSARGGAKTMPGAFLVRLRRGTRLDDENFNLGLAIRLKPGQTINKREMPAGTFVKTRGGFMLLYGPSVAQVFRDVARDIQGPVSDKVEAEFIRQFNRLSK